MTPIRFPEWLMLKIDRAYSDWSAAMWRRIECYRLGAVEDIDRRVYHMERSK